MFGTLSASADLQVFEDVRIILVFYVEEIVHHRQVYAFSEAPRSGEEEGLVLQITNVPDHECLVDKEIVPSDQCLEIIHSVGVIPPTHEDLMESWDNIIVVSGTMFDNSYSVHKFELPDSVRIGR